MSESHSNSSNPNSTNSTAKKAKYLSRTVRYGGKTVTLYSLDGTTWSTKREELEGIKERQEAQRANLFAGKTGGTGSYGPSFPQRGADEQPRAPVEKDQEYAEAEELEEEEGPFVKEEAEVDEADLDREEAELSSYGDVDEEALGEEEAEGVPPGLLESGGPENEEAAELDEAPEREEKVKVKKKGAIAGQKIAKKTGKKKGRELASERVGKKAAPKKSGGKKTSPKSKVMVKKGPGKAAKDRHSSSPKGRKKK